MKDIYIKDLSRIKNKNVEIFGWISRIHKLKKIIFIDLTDSTGLVQIVIDKNASSPELYSQALKLKIESAIAVKGKVIKGAKSKREIKPQEINIIGPASIQYSPSPRSNFDIFDPKYKHLLADKRHIYIRNPKFIHILKMRHAITNRAREWFNKNMFTELTAPILTPVALYEDSTALKIKIHNEKVFLTQCVGYYLEASVHALERVYNIGPSFRGEETHSKRHLMEYWHVKAEVAFADLEDIIKSVESLVKNISLFALKYNEENKKYLNRNICADGAKTPYPRITYEDAIKWLQKGKTKIRFGQSLGSKEEELLSKKFKNTPFWITGIPRKIEPFPYVIDQTNTEIVRVADLIASNGYGELLGVAEKIADIDMLKERLKEKGKHKDKRYNWIVEVHRLGVVPHAAFGMGLERLLRWLLDVPHVKDTIPFPRTFRRKIYP
jgi:asparaginyl-tRNA synthetase